MKRILVFTFVLSLLIGCGGNSDKKSSDETKPSSSTALAENEESEVSSDLTNSDTVKLVINGSDQMKFDQSELRVTAGSIVELTLNHTGKLPKESMGHNVVILKEGTNILAFTKKAIEAMDNEYIPEGDDVIAHTQLIGGGESTTVTFEAPEKGAYAFICSFPGHYGLMKGEFIVE